MALFICYCFFFSRMVFRRGAHDTDARWRRPRSVRRRWCDGDVVSSRKSGNVRYFIQLEKASKSQSSSALLAAADIAHTRTTYRQSVVQIPLCCVFKIRSKGEPVNISRGMETLGTPHGFGAPNPVPGYGSTRLDQRVQVSSNILLLFL